LTFENHCLEEEITFGDPFEDSGVVRVHSKISSVWNVDFRHQRERESESETTGYEPLVNLLESGCIMNSFPRLALPWSGSADACMGCPLSGDGVKSDPNEVLGRS